jgi:polyhydroxyalkanoate synthase
MPDRATHPVHHELAETASNAMLGPNPFIGFRPEDLAAAAGELTTEAVKHPTLVLEEQAELVREISRVFAGKSELKPEAGDKRFADPAWAENPFYRVWLGGYLAWTNVLNDFINKSTFDERTKNRARFVTGLVTDALAPSNSPLNPTALKRAIDTGGTSVAHGLRNMVSDVINNQGMPSMVDKTAFEVGKNLATTKGSVVYRNEVLELIQYKPQTETIFAIPYLLVPPQINKFYAFDISPGKSIAEFLLQGGIPTFVISWRNPKPAQRDWGLDTYVSAIVEAIAAVRSISGAEKINVGGACAGGMTLAALLGYYAAGEEESPINTATLLVAVLDGETGESTIFQFATKDTMEAAKAASKARGVLDGSEMGRIFAWLRPNDLVWNYWVNNYLVGNNPPAFDILYWNSDTTRLPAKFHADLIDAFAENKFKRHDALTVLGRQIDLAKVSVDSYFVAGITDHITPWKGVYASMRIFGGNKTFVLSAAGHIQSLINPPAAAAKRQYLLNPDYVEDADAWLKAATTAKGSWWGHWYDWLSQRSGEKVPAPAQLGNATHPIIEDAPGTYVREK